MRDENVKRQVINCKTDDTGLTMLEGAVFDFDYTLKIRI